MRRNWIRPGLLPEERTCSGPESAPCLRGSAWVRSRRIPFWASRLGGKAGEARRMADARIVLWTAIR